MAATLTKLKGFVQTYQGYNFEDISNSEKDELTSFVSEIVQSVKWEIEEDFYQRSDVGDKYKYINNIQSQLAYLADEVSGFEKNNCGPGGPEIFDWLLTETFKLLEHLRYYFSDYFNFEAKLPHSYLEWYRKGHVLTNNQLLTKLHETNVDHDLIKLIADFNQSDQGEGRFQMKTWKQMDYLVFAIEALVKAFSDPRPADMNLEILKLFVTIDFNSIYVYSYFIKYLERFTLGEGSFQEQQQELLYILKVFRQVRVDAKVPYDSRVQSLKISVVESLEAELNYLEQREKLYLQNFKATNPESPSKFYFNVAVTLAELMFFSGLCLKSRSFILNSILICTNLFQTISGRKEQRIYLKKACAIILIISHFRIVWFRMLKAGSLKWLLILTFIISYKVWSAISCHQADKAVHYCREI